jgi:hypothetical protein
MIKQYLDSEAGSIIISILLGLGLAALFRKACLDNNCVIIKGPPYKDIKDKIFIQEDKCYIYTPKSTQCEIKEAPQTEDTNNPKLTKEELLKDNFTEHQSELKLGF